MTFRVLLIDDEPMALEALHILIDWDKLGYEICGSCENGEEGLRLIEELRPDLVITDVDMPLLNGFEMIRRWQQTGGFRVRFAIISGYSEFEFARLAIRYGVNDYLLKPVDTDEAEAILGSLYGEMLQERERAKMSQVASYQESVTLIKGVIEGTPLSSAGRQMLENISALREAWNFCLVEAAPSQYVQLRQLTVSRLSTLHQEPVYLLDLDSSHFGIVYGSSAAEAEMNEPWGVLRELAQLYSSFRVFMATGAGTRSLLKIYTSYRTSAEAINYKFYDNNYTEIKTYSVKSGNVLQSHYDQILLVDGIAGAMNLLDAAGLRAEVHTATEGIRSVMAEPESVRKLVIHLMYKMLESIQEAKNEESEALTRKYIRHISGLSDQVLILNDLMEQLLGCGLACIDLLIGEQLRQSRGIVQEINDYIREHYREPLTIKKLAELFFMHPVYLGQLLSKRNGIGFNEWIHNLRIEEAVVLLKDNGLKNFEIAERVGYANYNQFLKQFEKRMGMSPNEYRSRN